VKRELQDGEYRSLLHQESVTTRVQVGLQVTFKPPAHDKTKHGIRPRDLSLMIKLETLQAVGAYTSAVYMLKVTPESRYPLTPVQEMPKAEISWWQLCQPLIVMDTL